MAHIGFQVIGRQDDGFAPWYYGGATQDRARNHVLEFAHVAGPGVAQQGVDGAGVEANRPHAHAPPGHVAKVASQQRDVLAAITQGRRGQRIHVQAVEEVGAKAARGHLGNQIAVGGGQDAHVDLQRAVSAHALDLAFLQGTQKLWLHGQRQLADLVEKQGSLVSNFELAGPVAGGARESPAHVTE